MNGFLFLLAAALVLLTQVSTELILPSGFIKDALNEAKIKVDKDYEYSRRESIARVRRNTANHADVLRLLRQPAGATRTAVRSADYMDATIRLIQKRALTAPDIQERSVNATDVISEKNLRLIRDLTGCSARASPPPCRTTPNVNRFRTPTNVCNNRNNPLLGSSNTPFVRWLPAEYQDGVSLPKGWDRTRQINRHILPMVREVSNLVLRTANCQVEEDSAYTHLLTIFGQWLDHDLDLTPTSPVIRSFEDAIDCDKTCNRTEPCFPIMIPRRDTRFNRCTKCMPFIRSAPACDAVGTAKPVRQQINAITAFIDAGMVYGADDAKARSVRDLTSEEGLLKVNGQFNDNGRELMHFSMTATNVCETRQKMTNVVDAQEVPCFSAGDGRANEHIGLLALHSVALREHNRLARALANLNPHWDGERLYQESRKIMGGYHQVITYRDYLSLIVGPEFHNKRLSNYPGYDENVDPSIANVFATAAYRFGHLAAQPYMFRLDEQYQEHPEFPSLLLHETFFTPWRVVFEGGVDPILRGLVGRKAKLNTQSHMMPDEMRERLFEFSSRLASDLASLNLQRGRDHGLPGYNKWRKFCGLSQPQSLRELTEVLNNNELSRKLLSLYGTPDNIDVWLGGVAEPFVPGGRVGPLFACIISKQFQNIRQGDR